MSIYSKLKLLIRASAEEPVRKLVDQNDIKIFEQEIYEAENSIKAAKLHLANVKTEEKCQARSLSKLKSDIALREQQTKEAMVKDDALAIDLAGLLAEDEITLQDQENQHRRLQVLDANLTANLRKAVLAFQSHSRQLQVIKANQHNLQNTSFNGDKHTSLNGVFRELNESLNNIKQRQLKASYFDDAEGEIEINMSGNQMDERIESAGITTGKHNAAAVLERLRSLN